MSREISNISETKSNRKEAKEAKEANKKDKQKKISKVESNNEQKINENTFFITTKNKKNNDNNIETEMTSDGKKKRVKNSHEPKAGLPSNRRPTLIRG